MSFYLLALWIGFLGSVHCGLMCGPLILALPFDAQSSLKSFWMHIQYHLGRIFTYALFGFIVGSLGQVLGQFTGHGQLSFSLGILLIFLSILYLWSTNFRTYAQRFNLSNTKLVKYFSQFYGKPIWPFLAGILNGLLPCGMVYLALASSLNSSSAIDGSIFMFSFGLGTLPLLLSVAIGGVYIKKYIQFNPNKMLPWFAMFLGTLLLFRSLHLGIPFLSPQEHLHYGSTLLCN